jgi:hypothetical protein
MRGNQAVMGKVATLGMNLLRRDAESIKSETRERERARARGARMCWVGPFLLQNQFRFMPLSERVCCSF